MVLGALGTVGVVLSMFLPWRTGSVQPSDVPAAFLWDRTTGAHDPSLLIYLIPLAILLGVGTVVPMGAAVRFLAGIGTLVVAGFFAYQLYEVLDPIGGKLGDVLDTGFYVGAIAGLVALVSGLMPSRWVIWGAADREPPTAP
jgi:hypothetical protein